MASPRSRSWTDPRDGQEWEILFDPGVELDNPGVRAFRERLVFRSPVGSFDAPAVYGSALDKLTGADLQGLLDQARGGAREG